MGFLVPVDRYRCKVSRNAFKLEIGQLLSEIWHCSAAVYILFFTGQLVIFRVIIVHIFHCNSLIQPYYDINKHDFYEIYLKKSAQIHKKWRESCIALKMS